MFLRKSIMYRPVPNLGGGVNLVYALPFFSQSPQQIDVTIHR